MALELNDQNFDQEIKNFDGVALVDFWASWCGPCRMIGPSIEQLATEYAGKASVYKVDIEKDPDIASKYGIMSIPALLVFKDGQIAEEPWHSSEPPITTR